MPQISERSPDRQPPAAPTWTPRMLRGALLRAAGRKWAEVAAECGVRETTARAWVLRPGWHELVARSVRKEARDLLTRTILPMLESLRRVIVETKDDMARVKACQALFDMTERWELLPFDAPAGEAGAAPRFGTLDVCGTIRVRVPQEDRRADDDRDADRRPLTAVPSGAA